MEEKTHQYTCLPVIMHRMQVLNSTAPTKRLWSTWTTGVLIKCGHRARQSDLLPSSKLYRIFNRICREFDDEDTEFSVPTSPADEAGGVATRAVDMTRICSQEP